jgi:hypothetical protein
MNSNRLYRDSCSCSVGIQARLRSTGPRNPGSIPSKITRFLSLPKPPDRLWDPLSTAGSFSGHEADRTEDRNEWIYCPIPPPIHLHFTNRDNFTLPALRLENNSMQWEMLQRKEYFLAKLATALPTEPYLPLLQILRQFLKYLLTCIGQQNYTRRNVSL